MTEPQKHAAQQVARVQQDKLLSDLEEIHERRAVADRSMRGVTCLGDAFTPNREAAYDLIDKIEAITANTRIRAKRYLAYNRALSGSAGRLNPSNPCDP